MQLVYKLCWNKQKHARKKLDGKKFDEYDLDACFAYPSNFNATTETALKL